MRRLASLIEVLSEKSGYFSAWLVPAMGLLVLAEVVSRYAVRQPFGVADEMSAYLLVALAYIGLAYTWKEKGHIRIDFLVSRLPVKFAARLRAVTMAMALAFSIMLTIESYSFAHMSITRHLRSNSWLATPLQVPHITISIGFTILSLLLIVETIKTIRKLKTENSTPAESKVKPQ